MKFGIILIVFCSFGVHLIFGTPVKMKETTNFMNLNGKTMTNDILRELSPEAESLLFGSFQFGVGDTRGRDTRSRDKFDDRQQRRRRYNRGDNIRYGYGFGRQNGRPRCRRNTNN
uniref:CSON010094 protein n=1 Tax=Culicoides sonorensis TaxID=179676 RepID=A0A336LKQ5_CULSO